MVLHFPNFKRSKTLVLGYWIRFWIKNNKNNWASGYLWFLSTNNFNLFFKRFFTIMIKATKKWLFLKISSLIMVPLMLWFLVNFVSLYDSSYNEILAFLSSQPSKLLFSLFLVSMFFYSALSISEVFDDYIHVESTKKLLNIGVFLSSLIIPLFTIILISNL